MSKSLPVGAGALSFAVCADEKQNGRSITKTDERNAARDFV